MASLLSFAKKKIQQVENDINPFDGPKAPARPAAPNRAAPSIAHQLGAKIQSEAPGLVPALSFVQHNVVQPIARSAIEIPASLGNHTITPPKFTRPLTGRESVKPIQADVAGVAHAVAAGHQTLPGGIPISPKLAIPYAAADAAMHVAGDLPLVGGAIKGAKLTAPAIKVAADARVPLNEAGAVGKDVKAAAKAPQKTAPRAIRPPTPTAQPKITPPKITTTDVATRSSVGVLDKIDPRLGDLVRKRREIGETQAAQAKAKLTVTNSLNKDEQTNLARVMKGSERPINDKVTAAAKESKKVLDTAYFRAKNSGVPVKAYRQNYFPQILNPKIYQDGSKQSDAAIRHLVITKQAKNDADAIGLLRKYKQSKKMGPYGNLSKSRSLDLPGYAENTAALHQYLDKTYATIAHTKVMGKDDKVLNKVLADVKKSGGDYDQAVKSYRQASGIDRGSQRGERVSRAATNFQGSTKLGLSALGNITQQANNAIVGGVGRTGKNLFTQGTKANRAFLADTGVKDEQVAHEALFGEQGVSRFRNVTAPGFEKVEKGNRGTSGLVGRDMAQALAKKAGAGDKKAADRLANEFGINSYTKNGLNKADQIKAARNFVERTQFRTGPQDLPGWASTPTGRVVSQFKRYPYKQTQFLKREVYDQAKKGNFAPLVRATAVGAPIGIGEQALADKLRGSSFTDETLPEKSLNIAGDATGANLLVSLAQGLYPNSADANSYASKVVKTLGGPTISDAVKGVQAGFDATKGKMTNAERLALSHIPIVGTPASNRLLPYQTSTPKGDSSVAKTGDPVKDKANADAELKAFKKNPPKGQGLTQLADGRYVYSIDGKVSTTTDLRTAGNAIRADSLQKSGKPFMETPNVANGGVVTRKSPDGKISSMTKTAFDYQLGTAKLTQLKNAGNVQGWMDTANKQLDSIAKQLQDPNIDPLDAIKLQNQADTLQKDMDKYVGYGGFTKGKSGSKVKVNTSGFATAAKSKAPKVSGVKVKKVASGGSLKTRKLSVSKIPKIA